MGTKFVSGLNDLETWCRQNNRLDLLNEWNYDKNDKMPCDVAAKGEYKAWWKVFYYDKNTDKTFLFEWRTMVCSRVNGHGCPYLSKSNPKVYVGFNDLYTTHPKIASQWHPYKNGNKTPYDYTRGSREKVWWYYPYDDIKTGKHYDFEWEAQINSRCNKDVGCPYLSGYAIYYGFNDLETQYPDISKEWHPTKNDKTPRETLCTSPKEVWWLKKYKDENTGKVYDLVWHDRVYDRTIRGKDCPYLSPKNPQVFRGFNDLATTHPELAKEWHPIKNGDLKPTDVSFGSSKKVWWYLPYDDPRTGKHFDFEWRCAVLNRTNGGNNCPYLTGHALWKGFNDLGSCYPDIAKEWHPIKNGNKTPFNVMKGSSERVWWLCKTCGKEWQSAVHSRTGTYKTGCPFCSSSKTEQIIYNMLLKYGFSFEHNYKFSDEKIKYYPFDFYLKNENVVIEADGQQHFEYANYFFSNIKEFEKRKRTDNFKSLFCYKNEIPLLRIPYIYNPNTDYSKITNMVYDFIKTKKVPQEIIDFYKQFNFSKYPEYIVNKGEC